ncbi:MAG: dethiobiotin synthase [Xanthomonadales bacterium]|nr:dethiobiotin synthase [Xanthomonadales bacterium]
MEKSAHAAAAKRAKPVPAAAAPIRGVFVTGTDTEIGKTLVSCALIHRLRSFGLCVAAMKPVATGNVAEAEDALALRAASGLEAPLKRINSFLYEPAIAPHIAATRAHRRIDLRRIARDYERLAESADFVVVEGVGGWMVPLGQRLMLADVPRRLGLPVILVVGLRLGCLNHALLTARAILDDGLILAGWIGNCVEDPMLAQTENIDTLKQRLPAPCLGIVPPLAKPADPRLASGHLRAANLRRALALGTEAR